MVRTGLDRLAAGEGPALEGGVSLLCHPASVDARLRHARELVQARGELRSLLGPEHGIDAAAQDMESVDSPEAEALVPVHNLYGDTFDSLRPTPSMFGGARWLVVDLQDIGSRYYTYIWTAVMAAEVALAQGMQVLVLDRPNPIGGIDASVEGGTVADGEESFVGLHPIAVRHGLTLAEVVDLTLRERGTSGLQRFEVLECEGWRREMLFGDTGLPWVLPSPNMPTLDTALVYPGQCLLEGTTLSEGRGTTRPFELFGAPWLDPRELLESIAEEDVPGLGLRAAHFKPMFQKHGHHQCAGLQLHVQEPGRVRSLRSAWAILRAAYRQRPVGFWRTEPYEFVSDRPAIDLLAGGDWLRHAIESGAPIPELVESQRAERDAFVERRRPFLRYE